MEQGQESTASQAESTEVPGEVATPAPAPTVESLQAEAEQLRERAESAEADVHQRDVTIGKQGAELGNFRQQAQEVPAPQPEAPAEISDERINEVFYENPAAAMRLIESQRQTEAQPMTQQDVTAALQSDPNYQELQRQAFAQRHPDLVDDLPTVHGIALKLGNEGKLVGLDAAQQEEAVVKATQEHILARKAPAEAAPTPPPVAPATAPSQVPQAPGADAPQVYDPAKAAAADRRGLIAEQQKKRGAPSVPPIP